MSEAKMDHPYIKTLFDRARRRYGEQHQMKKCAEECCELSTAILRFTNGCDGHTVTQCLDNVLEETADATIMVDQLYRIFRNTVDSQGRTITDIIIEKLTRLEQRLDKADNEGCADEA